MKTFSKVKEKPQQQSGRKSCDEEFGVDTRAADVLHTGKHRAAQSLNLADANSSRQEAVNYSSGTLSSAPPTSP